MKKLLLLTLLAVCLTGICAAQSPGINIAETPQVADSVLLQTIVDTEKGQPLLVFVWAGWCGPCFRAFLLMKTIEAQAYPKGVKTIYIGDKPIRNQMNDLEGFGLKGKHYLLDEKFDTIAAIREINVIPAYLIFDREGTLRYEGTGGNTTSQILLDELAKVW